MPDIKAKSRPANKSFGNSNANKFGNVGNNSSQNQNNANKIIGFGIGNNKNKSREIDSASTGLTGYNSSLQQSADNPEIHSNNQQQSHNGKPVLHVLYTTGLIKFLKSNFEKSYL